jgi:hypothetical protein
MTIDSPWMIGDVAEMRLDAAPDGAGYGFCILNEHKAPLLAFAYFTKGEAASARELIAEALEGATITPMLR